MSDDICHFLAEIVYSSNIVDSMYHHLVVGSGGLCTGKI